MNKDLFAEIWNLSPHQSSYLQAFTANYDVRGKDIIELGGAMPRSLVIDHLGANSWTCIQSIDYSLHRNDNQVPSNCTGDSSYNVIWANAEDFLTTSKSKWDALFSIAAFEHFLRLPEVIRKISKILSPFGTLFSIFAPIWSGPWGQHFTDRIPERFGQPNGEWTTQLIFNGPWDHLIYGATEYLEIYTSKFDREFAEELTYQTFQSPQINRLHFEDYRDLFVSASRTSTRIEALFDLPTGSNAQLQVELNRCISKFANTKYKNFQSSGIFIFQRFQ
jgi:hypothetical protein